MRNRFYACTALILCSSVALAQDASTTPVNTGALNLGNTGATPLLTPSLLSSPSSTEPAMGTFDTPALPGSTLTSGTESKPGATSDQESGFSLPGGSGYAPLNFTPGQGSFDRPPVRFSTTIQQGYDDNIYSSSGERGTQPVKGSLLTYATEGVDILISQSRLGLSLQATGGAQYYWDRNGDQLTPNGSLNLLFAYKLTPRAQFSAVINGSYTSQPSLSVINGISQSSGKGYLAANGKFDLLYQWKPRIATDTTYTIVGNVYSGATPSENDYLTQTLGQSLRYTLSSRLTGVLEARASQTTHDSDSQPDLNTYYLLVGGDVTVSQRLTGSLRTGATLQDPQGGGQGTSSSPYVETSLDYTLTRNSSLSLNGRYGFDNSGNAGTQSNNKSTRIGLAFSQVFSPKLRGTAGVNYDHTESVQASTSTSSTSQDAISGSLGVQYSLSKNLLLFANITRFQVFADQPTLENSRDTYFLGATYSY